MSFSLLLAQTAQYYDNANAEYGTKYVLRVLDFIWQQATTLTWLQAVIGISFGVIILMYGWRIYKALTVIGFGLLGLYIGLWIGDQFQKALPGAIVGGVLLVVLAIPLMRWAVAVLGAVAGGILAAGIWHSCNLPQQFVWAGGLIGIVAGGMISFVVFKLAVMLFTSFGGTSLIVSRRFRPHLSLRNLRLRPANNASQPTLLRQWLVLTSAALRRHAIWHTPPIQIPQGFKGVGGLIPNSGRFFNFSQRKLPNLTSKVL